MAERRMFAKSIIDSDNFVDMPATSRLLYYDLSMRADDDGFVNSPKKIIRMTGASEDDLRILIARKFIIPFDSGIVVIRHWRIHNYIQKDRYKPTLYGEEKAMLTEEKNKEYALYTECIQDVSNMDTECIQPVSNVDTQVRLGKVRLGKSEVRERVSKEQGEPVDNVDNVDNFSPFVSDAELQAILDHDGQNDIADKLAIWGDDEEDKKNYAYLLLSVKEDFEMDGMTVSHQLDGIKVDRDGENQLLTWQEIVERVGK